MASLGHEVITEDNRLFEVGVGGLHDVATGFNVVITVSKVGEVLDLRVYEPIKAFNPEALAKAVALITGIASFIASQLGEDAIREVDVVMNNKLVVVVNDEDKVKIGISVLK